MSFFYRLTIAINAVFLLMAICVHAQQDAVLDALLGESDHRDNHKKSTDSENDNVMSALLGQKEKNKEENRNGIGCSTPPILHTNPFPKQEHSTDLFSSVRASLAIIKTAHGSGSGFVAQIGNKKYLITNEHVLRGGKPISATLLDGKKMKFSRLEIGDNIDLARLLLNDQDVQSLKLASSKPTIDDAVHVFGNSLGSGVSTKITGKILGIGPDRIEVDAKFVRGNSGSPILINDGSVLAVATYLVKCKNPDNWIKSGTRFTETRRFGIKLNNVNWTPLSMNDYFARADALADLKTYCFELYDLLYTDKYFTGTNSEREWTYDIEKNESKFRANSEFVKLLSSVSKAYSFYAQDRDKSYYYASQASQAKNKQDKRIAIRKYRIHALEAQKKTKQADTAWEDMRNIPVNWAHNNKWITRRFKNEANFWADVTLKITEKDKK